MLSSDFGEYANSLYSAANFDTAFAVLTKAVNDLGFESVLYTYIPTNLWVNAPPSQPHFQVAENYSPKFLSHYQDARFDLVDPLIAAVTDGVKQPILWSGDICNSYIANDTRGREIFDVSLDYKIQDGITLPLMSGPHGIAGASFITSDKEGFDILLQERLQKLQIFTQTYHQLVLRSNDYMGNFLMPVFSSLNDLEIRFLAGLAAGKSQPEMASELNRSTKYLEQVMLKIRRKVSGVSDSDKPTVNRNQLLYYAGLVNLIKYADSL